MYKFTDTTGTASKDLPAEAMILNSDYIENQIEGYRTLYVKGREILAPSLQTAEITGRDGLLYHGRQFPVREITVGYQLIAATPEDFRAKYNALSYLLTEKEQSILAFADERGKYFTGTLSAADAPDPGRNAVTSEFTFTCTDPFKRSVGSKTVTSSGEDKTINYAGTWISYPVITANFSGAATEFICLHGNGAIIEVSDLKASDVLVIDVGKASITINGTAADGHGALGNDWSNFYLQQGNNPLRFNCTGTMPGITISYTEVYV
ncbi:MAG TPA: hypothetical protein DCZ61_09715 [Lachnospiraceae bacterium]|nr:hypothetical protein [Lachnospiraceae bacterium]